MRIVKTQRCFGGEIHFCEHDSRVTQSVMKFSSYVPGPKPRGALIWLSGLTCTDENFMAKAGAQKFLQQNNLMVICPDTSPRGLNLPGDHASDDFGEGASFYVDALTPGFVDHYQMFTYISEELYELVQTQYSLTQISLFGHSMGGHGALVIGLRHPQKFKSVSAFAPIVNPTRAPWGQKALRGYLGEDQTKWQAYDACELAKRGARHPRQILIDQGAADPFLTTQLMTSNLAHLEQFEVRMQDGYDHSYYFIASFIEDHIRFHAQHMN